MKHVGDLKLVEFISGKLQADKKGMVSSHLKLCPDCAQKAEELKKTWDILGQWDIEVEDYKVDYKIHEKIEDEKIRMSSPFKIFRINTSLLLRTAASILIAAMFGYAAARFSINDVGHNKQPPEYLSTLGLEMSTGFSQVVLENHSTGKGGS